MKILFLFPYPLKESPSQRFRFEQYLPELTSKGYQLAFQSFWDITTWKVLYRKGFLIQKITGFVTGFARRTAAVIRMRTYDYVFIHRECAPVGPPVFEWVIAKVWRKRIIYDFDDAIWLPNTSAENKAAAFLKWHHKVESICKWSYKLSCGNDFLADYGRSFNKNVVVNPTTIDTERMHNPSLFNYNKTRSSKPIVIGWTGTHSTLKYLKDIESVLKEIEIKYDKAVRFMIIANKPPQLNLNNLDFIPWRKESEIEDLLKSDIGIMPLEDDAWAQGKCGFKALQFMALGIPAVASPVGVNTKIIQDGINGFLATSTSSWLTSICKLIEDPKIRESIGAAGRNTVVEHYSVTSNTSTFLSLFE
jgi:glycosyltransferase involved in cell wall biosynthesis